MVVVINTEHFLEHLEYSDAITFLGECQRVPEIGVTMRIVVPDAEKYMGAYVNNDTTFFRQLRNLGGETREPCPPKMQLQPDVPYGRILPVCLRFETLEHVMRQIGFRTMQQSHHDDRSSPYCIDGQDWWRPVESIYVSLVK